MIDLNNLLGRVLSSGNEILNTPGKKMAAGGALAGILFTETGRDLAGSAIKYGGLAALGTLAYQAWQRHQAGSSAASESAGNGTYLPPQAETVTVAGGPAQERARLLLAAMINAAKADGHVDAEEQGAILAKADKLNLSPEERAYLFQEFSKPFDMEPFVIAATTPEAAAEIYAASAIGVGTASPAESSYLHLLAGRLKLPEGYVREVETALAQNRA